MAVRLTISYPPRVGWRKRTIETDVYDTRAQALRDVRDEFVNLDADDDDTLISVLARRQDVIVTIEEI